MTYDAAHDAQAGYALWVRYCRRVLDLRAAYGCLPSEARRLAMREMALVARTAPVPESHWLTSEASVPEVVMAADLDDARQPPCQSAPIDAAFAGGGAS
jgi:hypothetical protein